MARTTGAITKSTKAKQWIVTAKCLKMIGGTSMSLVCGSRRSGKRMTKYQDRKQAVPVQRMDAATGNERRPTVARRYAGNCSRCDEDERRR